MRASEALRVSPALREAVRSRVLPAQPREDVLAAARAIVEKGGGAVLCVVFFGSRKTDASPDRYSAYDFFVLTRGYLRFYRSLWALGALRHSPYVAAALNTWLPPNQVSVRRDPHPRGVPGGAPLGIGGEDEALAKCAVIALEALLRETSARRKDHFCVGRLFQPTEVLYAADAGVQAGVLEAIVRAHAFTYSWVRPWLPPRFDVETYCRKLLRVSLGREVRPEPTARAEALFEAQRAYLLPVYSVLLQDLSVAGELDVLPDGAFSLARPVRFSERLATDVYFRWSLVRATARWAKYVVTFEDWLEYIRRKAERHTGRPIVLTPRERRHPLALLWPKFFRFLRQKDHR